MRLGELLNVAAVLEIPDPFITTSRYRFSSLEALCLLCARLRTAGDQHDLSVKYSRSQSAISELVNELTFYLDQRWAHLLAFDPELLSPSALSEYASAVHAAGAPLHTIWGFIDCTIRSICRPSLWQRQAYNGHKKYHALKFQAVMLANGLFGHLYGPIEGRRHDTVVLTESHLLDWAQEHAILPGDGPLECRYLQIFGDPAYGINQQLISPFPNGGSTGEQRHWNAEMSSIRIEVEHGFGIVTKTWPFLNASWKMQIYHSPIALYYRVGVLLTNVLNCLRPNQVAQYFGCHPPSLEDYLHH